MNRLKIIALSCLLVAGCRKELFVTAPDPAGSYAYEALTEDGELFAAGTLVLDLSDTTRVEGSWFISRKKQVENVGPQIGAGTLTGTLEHDRLMVNLNPEMADNNVFLIGTRIEDGFQGQWQWVTFAGVTSEGPFEALK